MKPLVAVTILAVTNRSLTEASPPAFGGGRGNLSYERFIMQQVNSASGASSGVSAISHDIDPSKDFVTEGRQEFDRVWFEQTVDRMQKADDMVVVFVHGYNTSYQEAVFRLAQLSAGADVRAVPILFSWPSQADFRGYVTDRASTTSVRDDLVQLLAKLSRSRSKERIAVIGHSMGGWLVMEPLRQLRLQSRNDVIARLQVGLASPDIDVDVFRKQVAVIGPLSPPLTVLVSKDDPALDVSSRLTGGKPRLGLASAGDPQIQEIAPPERRADHRHYNLAPHRPLQSRSLRCLCGELFGDPQRDGSVGGVRHAGVFLLDTTGRILSAPFEGTARIIAGSP